MEITSLCTAGKIRLVKKTTRDWIAPKQLVVDDFIFLSNLREFSPIQGNFKYTGHFFGPLAFCWKRKSCLEILESIMVIQNSLLIRTSQRLQDRIRQYVPKSTRNRTDQKRKQTKCQSKSANSMSHCSSTIGNHLLHNQKCASHYKDN